MRGFGATPEQLAAFRDIHEREAIQVIEVLAENWNAVLVTMNCQWQKSISPDGHVYFAGVEAVEIEAVCRIRKVRLTRKLFSQVRHLVDEFATHRNAR